MTRVDFYILKDLDTSARHRFACRLACKATNGGTPVYMNASDQAMAGEIDDLLWVYPDQRMIPHGVQGTGLADGSAVVIGHGLPKQADGLMINLCDEVPGYFGRFERVAEIVVEANREAGRQAYKFYRDRGFPLYHHDLDEWDG
ncbi:MAG: DNA polymerase III subunit chi [Proteobacteria bacterium]|nr:DNA polymerase III subunit chi [Pseudomonadota bacterium]